MWLIVLIGFQTDWPSAFPQAAAAAATARLLIAPVRNSFFNSLFICCLHTPNDRSYISYTERLLYWKGNRGPCSREPTPVMHNLEMMNAKMFDHIPRL
jgi:hypothetical protein